MSGCNEIRDILCGIDRTNVESIRGWWETEKEALRGAHLLEKLEPVLAKHEAAANNINLPIWDCYWKNIFNVADASNKALLALYGFGE